MKNLKILELDYGLLADFAESDDLLPTVDLASLQTLQNLKRPDMYDVTILDFDPLAALTQLNHLTIHDLISNAPETFCGPENLKQLTKLPELRSLNIGINEVKDFSCLANLPKLKTLNVPYNGAETLDTNIGFGSLRYCNLDGCHLTDLTPFTGNTNLQYLNIGNHQLGDLSPLAGLSGLEILLARSEGPNTLPDLPSFPNLPALREIAFRTHSQEEDNALNRSFPKTRQRRDIY